MEPYSSHRLRAAFVAGHVDADEAIDRAIDALDAEQDPTREGALRTLVAATGNRPDRVTEVVDAVDASLRPGRALTPAELAALRDLARRRPRALSPLVDTFGTALSNPDESEIDTALVSRMLGDVGTAAPGVVKPALGPLANRADADRTETVGEASWAVVRTAVSEPAMLRPVVAGCVWDLDSHDPATVVGALETLGRVGWLLPDQLAGLDRVASLVEHPVSDVREAAVQTLGWLAGRKTESGLGVPSPDRAAPYLDRIAGRLADPDADVRLAAVAALGQFAREDPRFVRGHLDEVLSTTEDDSWFVRAAALDTLETALDPTAVAPERVQRYVLPRLVDGDGDVETAAVSLVAALVEEVGADRPALARHATDLLVWAEYVTGGTFDGPDPLATLEEVVESPPEVSRYLRVVRALADADDGGDRSTTVELCGFVARHSAPDRLAAIEVLQSMLGDEDESVRRQALAEFRELVETDPAVAHTVGHVVSVVFRYDPELRDEAASVLAACHAHEPGFLDEPVQLHCRFLRESREQADEDGDEDDEGLGDLFGGDSGGSRLETFVESAPRLVADAAPSLVERLSAGHDGAESVAKHLAYAVANGGNIDARTVRAVEEAIRDEDASPALVAWLSTLLLLGSGSDAVRKRATDRLHSLVERDETTPLPSCLTLLAETDPALVARLLVVYPPAAGLPPGVDFSEDTTELLADVVSAHPRLLLRCRGRDSPYSHRPLAPGYANDRDWLAELATVAPQTVPATDWLHDGFWADDGTVTARLLQTVGRADALPGDDALDRWTAHPHPDVRTRARELREATAASTDTLPDAEDANTTDATTADVSTTDATTADAPEETVDELATRVATHDPEVCRRALERLVSIGIHDPDVRAYVRQHLLASSVSLAEVAAPESHLGALLTLAPRAQTDDSAAAGALPDGPVDAGMLPSLYRHYATFGTAPVRDVALSALRSRPGGVVDASVVETLTERLGDPDDIVRAQAARTVSHVAVERDVISTALVDALVAELRGPRHVTVACCDALGQCGAVDPSVTERVVSELETQLRARERGVRRAAASALARIGETRPTALVSVADTLVDRLQSDRVVRSELLPAIASVPLSDVPNPDQVVDAALSELVETTDPSTSQAAGQLLVSVAAQSEAPVSGRLTDVSERLEEDFEESFMPEFTDLETTPLSTYWLLRVVAVCAEDNHLIVKHFEWLLAETIEALNEDATGFTSYKTVHDGRVTTRGLARVTARVVAFGGLDRYGEILERWFDDPAKPAPDPGETAHHLVIADPETRAETVTALGDSAPAAHIEATVDELLAMEINLNRYDAVFGALAKLLPRTDDRRLHRRGVTVLLDASSGRNWKICTAAVDTLGELARTDVVQADEVVAHLIGLFDLGSRADSTVADAVGDLLQHAQLGAETLFTSVLAHYEQSRGSPKRRQTAVRLVGVLGKRYPAVRDRAVPALVDAVSDDDRWVRKEAAMGLAGIKSVAPAALRPYREELEELAETASDGIAAKLESCVAATRRVD